MQFVEVSDGVGQVFVVDVVVVCDDEICCEGVCGGNGQCNGGGQCVQVVQQGYVVFFDWCMEWNNYVLYMCVMLVMG